ncbi:type I restriction enzyme subunit R domain-containing protein, partial [Sphaerotilus hippei]|uniref:type I restriction enzyme subunit R domain-containing protein n=1 Tax=Sphaerotilus hippei TaxID=744406 RepID=UPI004046D4C5
RPPRLRQTTTGISPSRSLSRPDLNQLASMKPRAVQTSPKAVDNWFEKAAKGLNNYQKSMLRKRWATMEDLMSSGERKQRIMADIIHDFGVRPRLNNDRGTAILVAASIYDACHYYRLFQNTGFGQHCGIVTSFEPNHNAISQEPKDSDERYKFDTYTQHVLKAVSGGGSGSFQTTTQYETEMKRRFIEEPANLKLLIVVSKLLTGFDAPSCTYIYLDNELRDHNLFQAICRTNRLDGEDKDYGHIVDYKESLENVQKALAVYTSDELDTDSCGEGADLTVKDWREEGRARLDAAREALIYLCAPVKQPQGIEQHIHYFCGSAGDAAALNDNEPLRIAFYKAVAAYVRAYADMAQNLEEAGYSAAKIDAFEKETAFYTELRAAIKNHAGEELDTKPFEADMRHLINTYIQADPADVLGDLSSLSLTELIIETGIHDAIARKLNEKGKLSNNAIAEGIINNVRKTIIRDQLTDPKFYEQMSKLLEDLIQQKRDDTESYAQFLKNAEALAKQLGGRSEGSNPLPAALQGNKEAAVLYNNLPGVLMAAELFNHTAEPAPAYGDECLNLALSLDRAIRDKAPAGWKGDPAREAQVLNAIFPIMKKNKAATLAIFEIIKNQPGY